MKYAKISDNIVVQIQPNMDVGFIEVDNNVCCGMIKDDDDFIAPEIVVPQDEENEIARKYLSDTDWYIIRFQETGEPIPEEISTLRAEAREKIV